MNEGDYVDRFGHDGGQFLAPLGTLYSKRSIPPSNLNPDPFWPVPKNIYNNYHVYRVIKPFKVYNGSIAAGFGQPGQGRQYYTKKVPIHTLLKGGDLEEVDPADVVDEVLKRGCK
ncbi:hypothetical protein QQS21_000312 [Conoideocrella luteorostrata]|uniref:TNT domain-containing protein n=1 Tax=Conoideocrella luteorostrata TaxID=1105319 RepID=A0AAJ0FZA7_9HYPO|nr:hypothetical protein QQS21_000312 [Conoideocrella luteorostrata]